MLLVKPAFLIGQGVLFRPPKRDRAPLSRGPVDQKTRATIAFLFFSFLPLLPGRPPTAARNAFSLFKNEKSIASWTARVNLYAIERIRVEDGSGKETRPEGPGGIRSFEFVLGDYASGGRARSRGRSARLFPRRGNRLWRRLALLDRCSPWSGCHSMRSRAKSATAGAGTRTTRRRWIIWRLSYSA